MAFNESSAEKAGQGPDAIGKSFSIGTWNIDGLLNKLNDSDFIKYVSTHSIFCVFETWLQTIPVNLATIFPKYTYFSVPAKKLTRYGRAMGGIVVFINKQFEQYITKVDINSECGIFLKIKKELLSLLSLNKDCYLCVYIYHRKVQTFMTIPR